MKHKKREPRGKSDYYYNQLTPAPKVGKFGMVYFFSIHLISTSVARGSFFLNVFQDCFQKAIGKLFLILQRMRIINRYLYKQLPCHGIVLNYLHSWGVSSVRMARGIKDWQRGKMYRPFWWHETHKIFSPGNILSPFLGHSTFTVRLQMVNYSGYG